jgi:hypothetical protein
VETELSVIDSFLGSEAGVSIQSLSRLPPKLPPDCLTWIDMSGDGSTIKSKFNSTISNGKASDGKSRDGCYHSPKPVVVGSSPTGRKEQAEADLAIQTFDGELFDIRTRSQ